MIASPALTEQAARHAFLSRSWRKRLIALGGLHGVLCLFFGLVWVTGAKHSPLSLATSFVFLGLRLVAVANGVYKLRRARFSVRQPSHWMLLCFTVSVLMGAFGTIIWMLYNYFGILVPYPSPADLGYGGGHTFLWVMGLFCSFAVLETTPRAEVGPFPGLLTATWSLTVVLTSLIHGSSWASENLPKLALDIYYPFMWALSCALAGSLVFGPQSKRLTAHWRAFAVVVYAASALLFLTNIAYTLTAACPPNSPAAKYLYYNGGPLDFLFATGNFLLLLAIVLLPLSRPVWRQSQATAGLSHAVSAGPNHPHPAAASVPATPVSRAHAIARPVARNRRSRPARQTLRRGSERGLNEQPSAPERPSTLSEQDLAKALTALAQELAALRQQGAPAAIDAAGADEAAAATHPASTQLDPAVMPLAPMAAESSGARPEPEPYAIETATGAVSRDHAGVTADTRRQTRRHSPAQQAQVTRRGAAASKSPAVQRLETNTAVPVAPAAQQPSGMAGEAQRSAANRAVEEALAVVRRVSSGQGRLAAGAAPAVTLEKPSVPGRGERTGRPILGGGGGATWRREPVRRRDVHPTAALADAFSPMGDAIPSVAHAFPSVLHALIP